MEQNIFDLIIIGGGPAGISAGIYAGRQGVKTLLLTEGFGGQMAKKAVEIENYPGFPKISGLDLINRFEEHLRNFKNVEIKMETIKKLDRSGDIFVIKTVSGKYMAKTAIIASGAEPRMLNATGEKEFIGKGVSYCPICDGPLFRNKEVAIIGGGNAGCEAAIFLFNYVKKLYILEFLAQLGAEKANQEAILKSGKAEIITNAKLKEIRGDKFVSEIIFEDQTNGKIKTLPVGGVFVEIGYRPATGFIEKELVDFTDKGEIAVDFDTCATKTAGLFAAGDITGGKCKQIVVAAGEGAKAALAANKFLKKS